MPVKPVTPDEAANYVENQPLPDDVVITINELIARNWDGTRAAFRNAEIADSIRFNVVRMAWSPISIARTYEAAGWTVDLDAPLIGGMKAIAFTRAAQDA